MTGRKKEQLLVANMINNLMSTETSKEKCTFENVLEFHCIECANTNPSDEGIMHDLFCFNEDCPCHSKPPVEENTIGRRDMKKNVFDVVDKAKQVGEHVCCDGECNHDDCCGKIEANCPNVVTSEKGKWHTDCPSNCPACAITGKAPSKKQSTTSEKECELGVKGCKGKYFHNHLDEVLDTPHESEDWNEFENTFDDHGTGVIETSPEALKSFIRKVYQRGREEGEQKLNIMKAACEGACDQDKMKLLSLAVQEIRKEKKEEPKKCICDRYTHCAWHTLHGGINQGLDKAIEIISGLMKK